MLGSNLINSPSIRVLINPFLKYFSNKSVKLPFLALIIGESIVIF